MSTGFIFVIRRSRSHIYPPTASLDSGSKGDVLILTTNTEVTVVPKLHRRRENDPKHLNERQGEPSASSSVLRVLPARLSPPLPEYHGPELLAFISPGTFSRLQIDAGMEGSTFLRVIHRRLPPPLDPSHSGPDDSEASVEQTTTRVLHAGGREQIQDTISAEDVYLGVADDIVASHIVFPVLPKGVEDWDIIR